MAKAHLDISFELLTRSAEATAAALENLARIIAVDSARELREYEIAVRVSIQFMGCDRRRIKREVRKAIDLDRQELRR